MTQKSSKWPFCGIVCYCHKNYSVGGQGIGQIFSNMKRLKHKQNIPPDGTSKQSTIKFKEVDPTSESGSSTKKLPEFRKQLQDDSMLDKEVVLKAEFIWALEILVPSIHLLKRRIIFVYVSWQRDCQTVSNGQK